MVEEGQPGSDAWLAAFQRSLRVGANGPFDWYAYRLQFREVNIKGRLDDSCDKEGVACFDRASDLDPLSIRPVSYF